VSIQVQADDRMPAYLLIPKNRKGRVPAIVCFYGTTSGEGKLTTVGLTPHKNRAFAIDMVEAGFVAFAADYLRDGERVSPGKRPYDTTEFYAQFPDWSVHGKDAWDTMRAIDYLQTLDVVDPDKIGMVGHSYGGTARSSPARWSRASRRPGRTVRSPTSSITACTGPCRRAAGAASRSRRCGAYILDRAP
jgi:dienelactone hydrolase